MHGCLPSSGMGTRWAYLLNTVTYAELQAALNNASYDGIYLEAGTYAITGNLVIPNGKTLSGAIFDTDPAVAAGVILNLTSGFQIQVQRGTFEYCRVSIDPLSGVNHITCNGGRVLHVHVTAINSNNAMAGFYGTFAELGWCSTQNVRGVFTFGSLTGTIGKWMFIHNCQFIRGTNSGNVVYINDGYVDLRDIYTEGGSEGYHLTGGVDKYYIHADNLVAAGAVGTAGFWIAAYHYGKFTNLVSVVTGAGTNGFYIQSCGECVFDNLISYQPPQKGFYIASNTRCRFTNLLSYSGSGTYGLDIAGNSNCQYTNIMADSHATNLTNAININSDTYCTYVDLIAYNCRGGGATSAIQINADYCDISNIVVYNSQLKSLLITGCERTCISNVEVSDGDGGTSQIEITSSTYLKCSNFMSYNSASIGIIISNCDRSTFTDMQSRLSVGVGIHITQCDHSSFTGINSREASTLGVSIGTSATAASLNTYCRFSDIQAYSNTTIGIGVFYSELCQFNNLNATTNTTDGVYSDNNSSCQFSTIMSYSNGQHGIDAGNGDSYCTWSDVHTSNNVGTNFFGVAATATCYYHGGFEQQGVAAANDNFPLANWNTADLVLIP